jgi:hypothetical protein
MSIRAWLYLLSGWTVCLSLGCVFHHSARDLPASPSDTPLSPEIVAAGKGAGQAAFPTPRHPSTTRSAATIEPPVPLLSDSPGPLLTDASPVGADLLPAETPVQMLPVAEVSASPMLLDPPIDRSQADPGELPAALKEEKLPPLVTALRAVLNRHPEEAARALYHVDSSRRDCLLALLRLTVDLEEQTLERLSPAEVDATLEHLRALCQQLRPRAPLKIRTACLCQAIQGFGQYERLAPDHVFVVGKPTNQPASRVQLYIEVSNFASKAIGQGRHETSLTTYLEIQDTSGTVVHALDLGTCTDHSHTPRRDYFLNVQFPLPANLPSGEYSLRVVVQDITAGPPREAQATLPLKIQSQRGQP